METTNVPQSTNQQQQSQQQPQQQQQIPQQQQKQMQQQQQQKPVNAPAKSEPQENTDKPKFEPNNQNQQINQHNNLNTQQQKVFLF